MPCSWLVLEAQVTDFHFLPDTVGKKKQWFTAVAVESGNSIMKGYFLLSIDKQNEEPWIT